MCLHRITMFFSPVYVWGQTAFDYNPSWASQREHSEGVLKTELEPVGISAGHTLGTVLCLGMVICPIFKWVDLKILAGQWPILDNVRWEGILKGEIIGRRKE